jgi:uncharacterized membrane protein YqjE
MNENGNGHPHLIGRGKSLIEQLLRMAQTRLELLSVELQEEKLALVREVRLAALVGVCGLLAGLTLVLWVALAFPPDARFVLLGVLFGLLTVGAVASWIILKRTTSARGPLFKHVIDQLRMDRASLGEQQDSSAGEHP